MNNDLVADPAVRALLDLPDRAFVDECYRRILLREPDPTGTVHQLERVRSGDDRLAIAADMSASDEARKIIRDRRSLAPNILALHAERLTVAARTAAKRRSAAARIRRYILVASGVSAPGHDQRRPSDNPFADYLNSVIADRN